MANVNVNRNVTDLFYRYKMPRLIAKVEGKGNGIKTVIVNMSEIAKSLSRPPTYPTKYFGCELGAQTQFDGAHDRYIVNGAHDAAKLQDLLDGFIKKFVLCPECENPETNLSVLQKKQAIVQRCIACGHQANVDMRHKLTTFILKNPPDSDSTSNDLSIATPGKKDKKEKEKEGKRSGKKPGKGGKDGDNGNNGDENASENNHHDSRRSKSSMNDDEDDDWGEDTSDAAVKARMEGLSGAAKTMTISDDLEKTEQERVNMFYSFVKQMVAAGNLSGAEKEKDIVAEAERLEIKDKAPLVLAELLFDVNMVQQLKQYKTLLQRFTAGNEKAQRYLLGGFEQLVGEVHPDVLMPKVPHILKAFYEFDILDEESILDWDKKSSKKYVSKDVSKELHTKAEPFIKWLKEAEEESSGEEEEDDSDVEVVYVDHTTPVQNNVSAAKPTGDVKKEVDEDDLNIDDI